MMEWLVGSVPVLVGWEDGGLGFMVYLHYEGALLLRGSGSKCCCDCEDEREEGVRKCHNRSRHIMLIKVIGLGHDHKHISKCFNGVMKATYNLPITTLVKSTYFHLGELFARKGTEA
ncbi:hypothetical protein Ahy_B03g066286 [Arachis hypogaea]|uniref:Uncharacterized protein n=1 Tax=Arachis hypogaea TaxID=3818 RepID=A0A445A3X2_ARAHY|nr:hypothetical protein Ahy_B03g066286 [Arachis hypogaea]